MKDVEKYIYVQNGIIWHGTANVSITSNQIGHNNNSESYTKTRQWFLNEFVVYYNDKESWTDSAKWQNDH